ncbi:MAG: chromosomal replication initiator protein DnaA [Nitrospiraceae bacterium]|jgi:chromosomal replication initiator protein|nr:MAG: chromosomal replication initiator protein DnaA [Nitrospiraceae bacterium]
MNLEEIWNNSLSKIEGKIGNSVFDLWFKPIKISSIKDQTVTLEIPNRFFKEWIEDSYPNLIKDSLETVVGYPVVLKYRVEEKQDTTQKKIISQLENKRIRLANKGIYLNPKYTFENFITGNSNQFAHAAAIAVAESPGKTYNPLFIYGGVGLGKTHLMHSIGNKVMNGKQDVSVLYVSSEQFTNEVVSAIRHEKMSDLKEKYRNLDLLLLDDVQFIANKTATQEEFFYTFNALYEKQKQIVISCDRPPKEISDVTDRLRSRFNMGLIADIQPPDVETKIAIIYKKAEMMGRKIPEDVAHYLASKIKSNIRELEGSLIRIAAQSSLTGEEINIETTKKLLKDIIHDDERPVTIDAIQKTVCDFYNLKLTDIKARRRTKDIALPRQVAMYISKQITDSSLNDIGKAFGGKDHATVIYACKQIEERRGKDETFNRMIENLLQKIKH